VGKKSSILTEWLTPVQANCLYESAPDEETGKKKLYMKGIFIQGAVKNHNDRIYPVQEIRKAVDSVTDKLKNEFTICGEADHPEELTINLQRVSHMITEMWMDGNNGMGKLQVLETPMGNIIKVLIDSGVRLGVSSRGVGNVNDNGIVSDYELLTVDIVSNSSAPNAYPKPVYESRLAKRGRIISDLAEAVSHDPKARKHLHKELLDWINKL